MIVASVGPVESDSLVCLWALVLGNGLYLSVLESLYDKPKKFNNPGTIQINLNEISVSML